MLGASGARLFHEALLVLFHLRVGLTKLALDHYKDIKKNRREVETKAALVQLGRQASAQHASNNAQPALRLRGKLCS